MQRLTSDFWVAATIRRIFSDGGFAAVVRRGATEAGAIYVSCRNRLGETLLYGPAAQADYVSDHPQGRLFTLLMRTFEPGDIAARIDKEARFDPDLWLIEIECDVDRVSDYLELVRP